MALCVYEGHFSHKAPPGKRRPGSATREAPRGTKRHRKAPRPPYVALSDDQKAPHTAGIELWNEASDFLMILKLFSEGFVKLFLVAALAMAVNLLARIVLAARQWSEIEDGKRRAFLWGALVYMIEPNKGQRLMKNALKDKAEGGMVYVCV